MSLTIEEHLKLVDVITLVFQSLKSQGTVYPSSDQMLRDIAFDQRLQAFRDLVNFKPMALAEELSPGECYRITPTGTRTSVADMVYAQLNSYYADDKNKVKTYKTWTRVTAGCFYLGLLLAVAFPVLLSLGAMFFHAPVPVDRVIAETQLGMAAGISGYGFIGLILLASFFQWLSQKRRISNERMTAVALLDAYAAYKKFIANKDEQTSLGTAQELAETTVRNLQPVPGQVTWATLGKERERISKIGREIEAKVIPSMIDHQKAEKIGETLVLLARHFMEASSEAMRNAFQLLSSLSAPETALAKPLVLVPGRVAFIDSFRRYSAAAVIVLLLSLPVYVLTGDWRTAMVPVTAVLAIMTLARMLKKT